LKYLITEEGRVVKSGANWIWEYNQTDHLGDVRTVVRRNATTGLADMVQDNHYFPFGMLMSDISTSSTDNRFRYNGKEYQNDLGFEWYDYGARFYDPALARWHSMDSEAENYYSMSPYNYVGNNPISRIDPCSRALAARVR
jgi:RHS repeat-associated protein